MNEARGRFRSIGVATHDDYALVDFRILAQVDVAGLVAGQHSVDMEPSRQYLAFLQP